MSLYFNGGSISAGSGGGSDDTYTKAEINGLLSAKSNTGLDNLNADGQMVIDSANGTISNCILEIPQNLKLELSGTTLTVKSGSIITLAGSTYSTVTLNSDLTKTLYRSTNTKYLIFYHGGIIHSERMLGEVTSGATADMPATFYNETLFYNTDDKCIYHKGSGTTGVIWEGASYPLCVVEKTNDVWSFAKDSNGNDMIFNGAGFIGHHQFIYPGDKGLKSKGYNTDGTLASDLVTTTSLQIIAMETNASGGVCLDSSGNAYLSDTNARYDEQANMYYRNSSDTNSYLPLTTYTTDSSNNVTSFSCRQPYEGARDLLTDNKQDDVTTITGYDSTQTQTLKNINGVLQWVTD